MLQTIREKTTGTVVKVLFGLLVLSFALWGIGDYAFLRTTDETAIKVGQTSVSLQQLDQEYRQARDRLRRAFGGEVDESLLRQFGVLDQTVERATTQAALDEEARRLGLVVSDALVRTRIASDPTFQGPTGQFDRFLFQRLLFENGFSEQRFVELVRADIRRQALLDAFEIGAVVPAALADRVYRHRNERRAGERVFVPAAAFQDVGEPTEAQLTETYDANIERFTAPEYRAVSVVRVGVEEVEAAIQIDAKALEEEFAARRAEFDVPERRELKQMLFANEAEARAALAAIEGGKTFDQVAGETPGQSPERASLGEVTRRETIPEIAEAAFAGEAGKSIGPVRTPFGWHVVQIVSVKPGEDATLESVRARIEPDLKRRLAAERAFEIANRVEDQITRGRTLEDAAAGAGASVVKVAAVDARGRNPAGEIESAFSGAPEAVRAAFETPAGRESQLIETRTGPFFVVRPDAVTPAQRRPMADVRAEVVALWQAERRDERAAERARAIVAAVEGGETLEAAALRLNVRIETIDPILRTGDGARLPAQIAARLFALEPGKLATAPGLEGHYVVRLTRIVPADPAADPNGVEQVRTQLRRDIAGDLTAEYAQGLRQRLGTTVNRAIVDRLN
ncbi:MAG: SurA N-terminal domain-containing protein [Azospirillum sp.]|nr:SurA N-terminal domain-containing protein [Azospirillum sp.]